jgi:hypothetical protein
VISLTKSACSACSAAQNNAMVTATGNYLVVWKRGRPSNGDCTSILKTTHSQNWRSAPEEVQHAEVITSVQRRRRYSVTEEILLVEAKALSRGNDHMNPSSRTHSERGPAVRWRMAGSCQALRMTRGQGKLGLQVAGDNRPPIMRHRQVKGVAKSRKKGSRASFGETPSVPRLGQSMQRSGSFQRMPLSHAAS